VTAATLQRLDRDDDAYDAAAARAAARCRTDEERSHLAAYLYLLPELSLDRIAGIFAVDVARARRLVERGSGTAPITAGDDCRGWSLVAPQPGRNAAERAAAQGHVSLCRSCRNRLRAHRVVERRVAKAGSATLGVGIVAAVVRGVAGSAGAVSSGAVPFAALSGALAVTAGAGALVATLHHGAGGRRPAQVVVPVVQVSSPATGSRDRLSDGGDTQSGSVTRSQRRSGSSSTPVAGTPSPGTSSLPLPTSLPTLPGRDTSVPLIGRLPVPLPSASVPVPSVSVSPPALPLPTISLSPPALLP
jgi:hypothetical protein